MKYHILKITRVVLALLFFISITFLFCDFAGIVPTQFRLLTQVQFVPALLSGSIIVIAALVAATFLFGRIYCSVICPLGILQDIISRLNIKRGKKNKKRRFHYTKSYDIIRYSLLAVCIVFLVFGIVTPVLFLDPYSNFGRIAVSIFRPIAIRRNNVLAWIALKFDNYSFHHVSVITVTCTSFLIALIALLTVGIMSFLKGRLFCNTICPVGSLLSLVSHYSLFGVKINPNKCTKCRRCERACKAECIDYTHYKVDNSRCVDCFNCLTRCKEGAINYSFRYGKKPVLNEAPVKENKASQPESKKNSRREFLVTSAAIGVTIPLLSSCVRNTVNNLGDTDITKLTPITPPGSRSLRHFKEKCTACHLCVTHCPQQILKPAGFGFGLGYALKPHLAFHEGGFCNYTCTICSEVCPNGAIEKITEEEKKLIQVGVAKLTLDLCVVKKDHTSCGACSEHCPTQAVRMEPYEDGLTIPHIHEELCIGCGGCESICPVVPIKAINVLANEVHQKAQPIQEEEEKEIDLDKLDFGF